MKFKTFLIVSLFLAILTIGAVSASEGNSTSDDVVAQENPIDVSQISQDSSDSAGIQEDSIYVLEVDRDSSESILAGENVTLYATIPYVWLGEVSDTEAFINDDATGKLSMYVDNKKVKDNILDYVKKNNYVPGFDKDYGKHTLELKYSGDSKYNPASYSTSFYYSYFGLDYVGWKEYYLTENKYGEGLSLDNFFYFEDGIKMNMKVYVDDNLIFNKSVGDSRTINIGNLKGLKHTYKVVAAGKGKKYPSLTIKGTFTRDVRPIINLNKLMIVSTDSDITVTLPSDANGVLKIYVDDEEVKATMSNGKAKTSLKNIAIGLHSIRVVYANDTQYPDYDSLNVNENEEYEVQVIGEGFKITPAATIRKDSDAEVIFTGSGDVEGFVDMECGYGSFSSDYRNGTAKVSINLDKTGIQEVKYTFVRYNGGEITGTFKVNVLPNKPIITASNFKIDYSSKTKFKALIKDWNYNAVGKGKAVTFELYKYDSFEKKLGKKVAVKTAKTDKNGYAKITFDVAPGNYKIKIKYGGTTVTKKYDVNSILKGNDILKHKKDTVDITVISKTIKIGATLKKVDGKYLKGKKIKFEFLKYSESKHKDIKYKTYTAKTNSKGVAKLTFTKPPAKVAAWEMEAGVGYTVRVSYGKDEIYCSYTLYSKSPFRYYFVTNYGYA